MLGAGDSADRVDHWIGRIERGEAEANAWCELLADDEDTSDSDNSDARVEHELAALKENRGK